MPEPISLNKLEQYLSFFNKMYDAVRIVDPVQKRVLEYRGQTVGQTNEVCYEYWKSGKICDNCISVRSYNNGISYMKLERSADLVMLVTAIPVETAEEPVVLELLKNATDSMLIGSGDYNVGQALRSVVFDINDIVIRDHLTGVYNRRYVDDRLPVDIVNATVMQQPLTLFFLDIDNMKRINDTHGHAAGDQALIHTAAVLRGCVRADMDWVARYGGDEFVVCLNNIGGDEAGRIAARIHSGIAEIRIPVRGGTVGVAASMGMQTMTDAAYTAEELIALADDRMYEAKRGGGGRPHNPADAAPPC